jgi:hypothetical protein
VGGECRGQVVSGLDPWSRWRVVRHWIVEALEFCSGYLYSIRETAGQRFKCKLLMYWENADQDLVANLGIEGGQRLRIYI